ncbi:uncharacterized protein Z518_11316 [Rhinocladiella mackenziei CBS 650.93]|uniref:Aminoglycoside phosphotransferase domain-containing protein n=1 Tax=Rhinocladiella mackenziei CBS 650.93 TaxID=1442369 RepID=A0A0D2GMJ8_9EURO|nr:uncharacterized protein Z518_11316 [Rhinocladiella mackenziei CBS 650.93]KIW99577.1 hypothetical protein Z518_11316 [Rhinocladiella mackenziei CBS 650.93]
MSLLPTTRSSSSGSSDHGLDDAALSSYLGRVHEVPGLRVPVKTTKIGYGQSNPTYFVDDAVGTRFVLRKKPAGPLISPVAHQVDREFKVLQGLGMVHGFPVPKVYLLCMDPAVIGTEFYIMEFISGRIIKDLDLGELPLAERRQAWFSLIETLGWLHSLDPDSLGLQNYGKKADFYKRQCNTFSRIEAQQAAVKDKTTGEVLGRAHAGFDEVISYVRDHLPGNRVAIVHGDFKFDNVILHPTQPRVIGILDWELSTIGHPLMDLAFTLSPFWNEHYKIGRPRSQYHESPYTDANREASGMPTADELLDRYSTMVGFDPRTEGNGQDWEVAKIFQHVRGATISHGIKARTFRGQASSESSHIYFDHTPKSLETALAAVRALKAGQGVKAKL